MHSNAIKPRLTETNKLSRIRWGLSQINSHLDGYTFKNQYERVHIDEKWFYLTEESARFYLDPEEEHPLRTTQSKKFITKIMFLAAVARPRDHPWGEPMGPFDGKIGIWPFAYEVGLQTRKCP